MAKSRITPIDNSIADIDAIANGRKYPDFKLDQDLMREVQMSWAMFVEHKGGLEEAEKAVKNRLQKVDPDFATLIYGDEARPFEDENSTEDGDGGLMLSRNRGIPKSITYDSPEGRRRMAALARAGAPPMDRGLDRSNGEASPGGLGQAINDMMGKVAAPTSAEAPQNQAQGSAKAKARGKSRPRPQKERKGSDLASVGSLNSAGPPGSVASLNSAGPPGSVESLRSSGPGLSEPTTDDGTDAVAASGEAHVAPVTEPAQGYSRPGIWRSPSSLSSLSALSRKVSI
eukprot:TRINITY_DN2928_c1_g2_i1.p1 TRINITY_DN2928_c1_g2~~TRINITY_DN2928_c1_g2_i1.p1  ORF type:complete len:309 (-),score=54.59 TRINITY_DN2928_c1_g2_i1:194-1051(-)